MPRLLACRACGVLYRMQDYDGPPEYDMELIELCNRHLGQAGDGRPESHPSMIFRCDEATAAKLDMESEVKKELMNNHVWVKDYRDELKVEAMKCFNRHNRPKEGCLDWRDESKTIGRKTGVPKDKRQYLCTYCPVSTYYQTQHFIKTGAYDRK